jgi:hypothetical protein
VKKSPFKAEHHGTRPHTWQVTESRVQGRAPCMNFFLFLCAKNRSTSSEAKKAKNRWSNPSAVCDVINVVADSWLECKNIWSNLSHLYGIHSSNRKESGLPRGMSWSHAWQRFTRSKGVKLNGTLECK